MKIAVRICFAIGFISLAALILLRILHIHHLLLLANILLFAFLLGFIFYFAEKWTMWTKRGLSLNTKLLATTVYAAVIIYIIGDIARINRIAAGYEYASFIAPVLIAFFFLYLIYNRYSGRIKGKPTSTEKLIELGLTVDDLDEYTGVYKNEKLPMKITVTNKEATLVAQANGQAAFYLDAISKLEFEYVAGGIGIDFDEDKQKFTLKQMGGYFPFIRQ